MILFLLFFCKLGFFWKYKLKQIFKKFWWQTSISQSPCISLMEESKQLAWIICSFHWDECQTLWLITSLGSLWNGERFLKGFKGKNMGDCVGHTEIRTNTSIPTLSLAPGLPDLLLVSQCPHTAWPIFPDHPSLQNGTGGRYLSRNCPTLGTFGDFSLLSWYSFGSHSSWSYFLLVCGWRNLCLFEHVKGYLCALTLSL